MTSLIWIKSTADEWLDLNSFNIDTCKTRLGVYIIWHGGANPKVVRVGQGDIAERLACHREDDEVQAYAGFGLYVTWAATSALEIDGIERYLADALSPLVGTRWPAAVPLRVNTPWAA